jgi:pyridoxal phosphate enzyme (YggS family)
MHTNDSPYVLDTAALQHWTPLLKARWQSLLASHPSLSEGKATVVAVSKYASLEQMVAAYRAGARYFGENQVQSAQQKQQAWQQLAQQGLLGPVEWHLLGPLQRNKVNKVISKEGMLFSCLQAVDSTALAHKLNERAGSFSLEQDYLLQVNISREAQKAGISPEQLIDVVAAFQECKQLRLRGLMGIAKAGASCEELSASFNGLRQQYEQLQGSVGESITMLSMGMSQDYLQALDSGANHIRVGSYLFKP